VARSFRVQLASPETIAGDAAAARLARSSADEARAVSVIESGIGSMKIDREYFLKRFRSLETDEIFNEISDRELSDEALESVGAVLVRAWLQ
jgi:hypothetical protein